MSLGWLDVWWFHDKQRALSQTVLVDPSVYYIPKGRGHRALRQGRRLRPGFIWPLSEPRPPSARGKRQQPWAPIHLRRPTARHPHCCSRVGSIFHSRASLHRGHEGARLRDTGDFPTAGTCPRFLLSSRLFLWQRGSGLTLRPWTPSKGLS